MFDKRLLALVTQAKKFIAGNVVLQWLALLANIVTMMCLGLFLQPLFTHTASGAILGITQVPVAALVMVAIVAIIVRAACTIGADRMGTAASTEAKRVIRTKLYDKLMRLGPNYTEQISTSAATQVSVEGVEQLEVYFGAYMPQFFYAVIAPITLFVCLAPLSFPAAIVLLVCVPLIPASIVMFQKVAKRLMKNYWGSYTDLGGMFLENIQGLTTLKIYQADEARHEQMNDQAEGFRCATMNVLRMQLNSVTIMDVLAYGGSAIGIIIALWQFFVGDLGFAATFAIIFLSADFFLPMRRLGSLFHTAMNGMAAADRMFELLAQPEPEGRTESVDGKPARVRLQGLSYSYDGERTVLDRIDFEAQPGSFVAVVGESGSGKSTLAGVLSGRNCRYEGTAEIGGVALNSIDRASLARMLTTVGFNSRLFKGAVRDNLAMALDPREDCDDARLWDALERAQVAGFVRANGGLDMAIAEDAANLSGGQRQRIVLARALLHDSPMYLFDEATSSIDPTSEAAVLRVIHELVANGKTVIMISHRLSNVVDADVIYALENGRVAEYGSHDQLLAQDGAYATLVASQRELETFAQAKGVTTNAQGGNEAADASDVSRELEEADAPIAPDSAPVVAPKRSGFGVMARMIGLVGPLSGYMVLAVVLGIVGFLCAIMVTVVGSDALATCAAGTAANLVPFGVVIAVVAVLRGPLHYGEQICNHYIAFRLLALVRDRVFAALRRLAPAKLQGRDCGNLISLVTADIELLEVFYAHTISPIIIAVVTCVVMLVLIAAQSIAMALLALCAYAVIGIVVPLVASKTSAGLGRISRERVGALNSFVLESLRCLPETVQFDQQQKRSDKLQHDMADLAQTERALKTRAAGSSAITYALVLAFDAAMALLGASLVAAGEVSPVQAVLALALLMSSYGPVIATANLGTTLQATLASGARVIDLLDEEPETADVLEGVAIDEAPFTGADVDDVSFSYGAAEVLSHVSMTIEPGRVVRIAGKSGSGKSTLCKLLMRFWDVTSGAVRVSGEDIRTVNTPSLRRVQSYMTQDTHLFCGTLRENVALANPQASEDALLAACDKAALGDLIARLPQGLDTQVGELGDTLSGGERQRIGLARVFLHDAPFVLLDEPTSNLDAMNEAAVLRSINAEKRGKTIVLVSHRESSAALADVTFTAEGGRVS